jgi:hypothetical protein
VASNLFPIIETTKPDYIVTLLPDQAMQRLPFDG